jgi:radical SAM-linked protein
MRIRLTFSKGGALRYTGHLDLHKIWERSFRRAGLPLAYSQGFHPQPKIQLASALPLGINSRVELLDFWTNQDIDLHTLPEVMAGHMPPGLEILSSQQVDERQPTLQTQVLAAEYQLQLREAGSPPDLDQRVSSLLAADSIVRERRGKQYDLRPLIEDLQVTGKHMLRMRLAAREGATGRPEEVLAALQIPLEEANIERTCLVVTSSDTGGTS